MPNELPQFFAAEQNLSALRRLLTMLPSRGTAGQGGHDVAPQLRQIVQIMVSNAGRFDELCHANIKWIGSSFISGAQNYEPEGMAPEHSLTNLFTMAYRFLCELEFSMPQDLSFELRRVKSFVDDNLSSFPEEMKRQLVFANYLMPAAIARELLHHPDLAVMRDFNEQQASASKLKKQWDEELQQKEEKIEELRQQLGQLETGFNFVGLVEGFRQLARQKRREKRIAFVSLLALGAIVISPVLAEAAFIGLNNDSLEEYKQGLLFALPPLITLEILLIYFFRVVLVHFRSIKAQLLQLELRTSLCQFIQSYSTYSAKIKEKDSSALEKFENLIFSGLLASEENLPSTFDGTEQLAKLIKSIKVSP